MHKKILLAAMAASLIGEPQLGAQGSASSLGFLASNARLSALSALSSLNSAGTANWEIARIERHLPEMMQQGAAADSLWRAGRRAVADEEWDRAVQIFASVRSRFPRSTYVGDSYYWQAHAHYQKGSNASLRQAIALLEQQLEDYPSASTTGDARSLRTRIRGMLAQTGDEPSAAAIARIAGDAAALGISAAARALNEVAGAAAGAGSSNRGSTRSSQSSGCKAEEDDERVMALNALLQMNGDDALPLLKQVLARRDQCSEVLRRKAVFLVSQKRGSEAADILMEAAKNDPDRQTREDAVFWLSSVAGDRSVTLLEQILKSSTDRAIQEKAIFSLHNSNRPRAYEILRDYAVRDDAPGDLRENAIFWLGQRRSEENAQFLRDLFGRVRTRELKEKIIFSLSQQRSPGNDKFLLDLAMNAALDMELRKNALFWAGQQGVADVAQLSAVYDKATEVEFKEQVIFVLQQKGRNAAAIDKLIDIAKNDRNRELRSKAIFWLGQSRDPRALKAIQEIILKPDGE